MKKKTMKIIATIIVAAIAFGSIGVSALDYDVPEGSSVKTARFNVIDTEAPGSEFSMISECGELVIHINDDVIIYFEDYVPKSDNEEDGMTQMVRDVLFGRTLAEVLDGRNLVVTYAVTTRSIPPQTTPISIKVLFEDIVPLPSDPPDTDDVSLPFEDVNPDDWFYNHVGWAFQNSIMNGISATEFAPHAEMTRAMLVTILWRYAGSPDAETSPFSDVAENTWYSTAVAWAASNEIVLGYDETTFGVGDSINREQMYTILYRYMDFAGLTISLDDEDEMRLQQFADDDKISQWARDALYLMYDAGIMFRQHDFDTYARPQEPANRGEIAAAMFFFDMYATP